MLKPLRHPTIFVLLTLVLTGWVYGAAADRYASLTIASRIQHGWSRPPNIASYTSFSSGAAYSVWLFDDPGGITALRFPNDARPTRADTSKPFARIAVEYHDLREYGLVLPVVVRGTVVPNVTQLRLSSTNPTPTELIDAARAQGVLPTNVELVWDIRNLAHDAALALTILVWLYAFFTIPTWKLWRSLSPAQRRRNRGACPNCGYDRSATPDKPCPECGSPIPRATRSASTE